MTLDHDEGGGLSVAVGIMSPEALNADDEAASDMRWIDGLRPDQHNLRPDQPLLIHPRPQEQPIFFAQVTHGGDVRHNCVEPTPQELADVLKDEAGVWWPENYGG